MQHEREIEALLSPDRTASVFDRLMTLPQAAEDAQKPDEWSRAVAGRFEAHLVRQMRALIDRAEGDDAGGGRKDAA
jgi:hypothetical protein